MVMAAPHVPIETVEDFVLSYLRGLAKTQYGGVSMSQLVVGVRHNCLCDALISADWIKVAALNLVSQGKAKLTAGWGFMAAEQHD